MSAPFLLIGAVEGLPLEPPLGAPPDCLDAEADGAVVHGLHHQHHRHHHARPHRRLQRRRHRARPHPRPRLPPRAPLASGGRGGRRPVGADRGEVGEVDGAGGEGGCYGGRGGEEEDEGARRFSGVHAVAALPCRGCGG
uniref:Uncharacterized protein n=1 Tax=Arundo donax TaxID=35708 RepID=A0A0A9HIK0_ARUDO